MPVEIWNSVHFSIFTLLLLSLSHSPFSFPFNLRFFSISFFQQMGCLSMEHAGATNGCTKLCRRKWSSVSEIQAIKWKAESATSAQPTVTVYDPMLGKQCGISHGPRALQYLDTIGEGLCSERRRETGILLLLVERSKPNFQSKTQHDRQL